MSFAELASQTRAVQLLQRSLAQGRLGHAYLFTGDDPSLLERTAIALAQVVNCAQPVKSSDGGGGIDGCNECRHCRRIRNLLHPDVRWVRPESKSRVILIDQVRSLLEWIHLKPGEATYKVTIIAGADRLNPAAANALLKTLEEPPVRSILILLATDPRRLLDTVVSRCLRLTFASSGELTLDAAELDWLQRFGEDSGKSGLLERYRLLGILLSRLARTREEVDAAQTAASPLARFEDIDPKLRERWEDELAAGIEAEYRRRRSDSLALLHWWLRDVWLQTLDRSDGLLKLPQLDGATRKVAGRLSASDATSNLAILDQVQRLLNTNVQEALALEVGLLRLRL